MVSTSFCFNFILKHPSIGLKRFGAKREEKHLLLSTAKVLQMEEVNNG